MECVIDGCNRPLKNRKTGYCASHYMRHRRGVPVNGPIHDRRLAPWPTCTIDGCDRRSESKTGKMKHVCPVHANQIRRGEEPRMTKVLGQYTVCQVPGCGDEFRSNKMCNAHATRARYYSLGADEFIELVSRPCAICGERPDKGVNIDHDHSCCPGEGSCGKCVRGALCGPCNLGLGAFRDNRDKLEAAARYLLLADRASVV